MKNHLHCPVTDAAVAAESHIVAAVVVGALAEPFVPACTGVVAVVVGKGLMLRQAAAIRQ